MVDARTGKPVARDYLGYPTQPSRPAPGATKPAFPDLLKQSDQTRTGRSQSRSDQRPAGGEQQRSSSKTGSKSGSKPGSRSGSASGSKSGSPSGGNRTSQSYGGGGSAQSGSDSAFDWQLGGLPKPKPGGGSGGGGLPRRSSGAYR
ncbi:hypothetical protein B0A55_08893 [Friedmanniomyces simplex]|uniref:Uncharacterized protein n=1 Tax=Friedmanniomyces simplex TaxID=329884 RepID=A0A4U0XFB3_9PEZI|nr:hypothetical protein B0A55_08893 [Friedmanniomyces simplex]